MLEFNIGELATRLRTALGVRGRIPLGLDEHVIPVTIAARVDTPPWRKNPVLGQSGLYAETAVSGRTQIISLAFRSIGAGVYNYRASVFVLTGWCIQPLSFVTATPTVAATGNKVTAVFDPAGTNALGAANKLITTEREAIDPAASLTPYELPISLRTGNVVGSPPTVGVLGVSQAGVVQPAVWTPQELLIRQGQQVDFWAIPASATVTSALAVQVQGLFYGLG